MVLSYFLYSYLTWLKFKGIVLKLKRTVNSEFLVSLHCLPPNFLLTGKSPWTYMVRSKPKMENMLTLDHIYIYFKYNHCLGEACIYHVGNYSSQ